MVHERKEYDIWDVVKYFKTFVNKSVFCVTTNTLNEPQTKEVIRFIEYALEVNTNYKEIGGISRETLDLAGIFFFFKPMYIKQIKYFFKPKCTVIYCTVLMEERLIVF